MFQTEIVIYIQSFSSEFLNFFFLLITSMGYESFLRPFLIIFIFGVSYKRGFLILHLVLWTAITTEILKDVFALPRPSHVDSAVLLLGKGYKNPTLLQGMGAKSFFGLLPPESIEYIRRLRFDSFGLPSGHTSGAVALWGGMATLYRKRFLTISCVVLIVLIPLSRIYLGRHFLADILGGYIVGLIFLGIFYKYIFFNDEFGQLFFNISKKVEINPATIILIFYFFGAPPLLLFLPQVDARMSAILLGLNIGFFLVWLKGIPNCTASIRMRIIRVVISIIFFIAISLISDWISEFIKSEKSALLEYIFQAAILGLITWISTEVIIKLKLMSR